MTNPISTIHYRSIPEYKQEIMTGRSYLHPQNFIVDPINTEYIPLCFIFNDLFKFDLITKEITGSKKYPVMYNYITASINEFVGVYSYIRTNGCNDEMQSDNDDHKYFNSGLILDDQEVLFAACIKTADLKEIVIKSMEKIANNSFIKLAIEKDAVDEPIIDTIIKSRSINISMELLSELKTYVFINKDKFENTIASIDTFSNWTENSETIIDNMGDWFTSKLFVQPEVPSFNDIDGPDRFAKIAIT